MKLICAVNDAHMPLYERYLYPSATKQGLTVWCGKIESKSDGNYMGDGYMTCLHHKLAYLQQRMAYLKTNEICICSDADIVVFKPVHSFIMQFFNKHQCDIAWAAEDRSESTGRVNGGWFACRNCTSIHGLFTDVISEMVGREYRMHDQDIINEWISAGCMDLRYAILPPNLFANGGNYGLCRDSMCYHANYTTGENNVQQKIAILEKAINVVNGQQ